METVLDSDISRDYLPPEATEIFFSSENVILGSSTGEGKGDDYTEWPED